MAVNASRAWLICYDIRDPKRLGRLHRYVKTFASPVQYSVYYFEGNLARLRRHLKDVEGYVNLKEDDVRAYPIPDRVYLETLGRGVMPSGVLLSSTKSPGLEVLTRPARGGEDPQKEVVR